MTQTSDYKSRLLSKVQAKTAEADTGTQRFMTLAGSDDQIAEVIARLTDPEAGPKDQLAALGDLHVITNFSKVLPTRSADLTNALRGLIGSPDAEVRRQALSILSLMNDEIAQQHLRDALTDKRPEAEKLVPTYQAIAMLAAHEKGIDKKLLLDIVENPPDDESLVQAVRHIPADEETAAALTRVLADEKRPLAARALVPDIVNNVDPGGFAATARKVLEDEGPDSGIAPFLARGAAGIRTGDTVQRVEDLKLTIRRMMAQGPSAFREAADMLDANDDHNNDDKGAE